MIEDLERLYRSRRAEFCRAAAAIAGDRALGEDAVQEAFARAVRKRRSFRARGSLEAWVWRIVVNAARDARRRQPAVIVVAPATAPCNGHAPVLPLELLAERQRDYATIAGALGISSGTVGATLSTARRLLRQALATEVSS